MSRASIFIACSLEVALLLDCMLSNYLLSVEHATANGKKIMEICIYWFLLSLSLPGLKMTIGRFYLLVTATAMGILKARSTP